MPGLRNRKAGRRHDKNSDIPRPYGSGRDPRGCDFQLLPETVAEFAEAMTVGYRQRTGGTAKIYIFEPSAGAHLL